MCCLTAKILSIFKMMEMVHISKNYFSRNNLGDELRYNILIKIYLEVLNNSNSYSRAMFKKPNVAC